MFSAKSSLRSRRPFAKTLKLVVWAFSLNFLHDSTLFVIDIHQNVPISLILTPFDHFQIRLTFAVTPNLILEPCHIFICDISYFITFHTMRSFPTRLSTFWWQWVRMWTEKVKMGARLSDVLFRLVFIIIIINYHQYCYYHHQYNFSKEGHTCVVKILLDKGASLTDKVIELSKNVGNDIHLSWFFYWPSFFYLSVLIDWLIELASLTRCHS